MLATQTRVGPNKALQVAEGTRCSHPVAATVNLPVIDRGLVFHRKAHGHKGTVRGPFGAAEAVSRYTASAAKREVS